MFYANKSYTKHVMIAIQERFFLEMRKNSEELVKKQTIACVKQNEK